jgi:lipoprotein NlpI
MRYILALVLALMGALTGALAVVPTAGPAAVEQTAASRPPDPQRERAYRANNIGVALLEQFDYEAAARSFRETLQLAPDLSVARVNLAIALFYGGKPAEAAVEARAAAERLPDLPSAHYVLGLVAKTEDRADEAIAAFGRVLQLDPTDAGARVHLGQIHLQQRRYEDALRLFEEALAIEPHNVTASYNVTLALTRSGRGEDARRAMQRFEALRDSAYGVTYSQAYLAQGRYGEAIASTGAEPELVNAATPPVTFTDATAALLPETVRLKPDATSTGTPTPDPTSTGTPTTDPSATGVVSGFSRTSSSGRTERDSRGGVLLFDADADGDLDLLEGGRSGTRFLRYTGARFVDETARTGLGALGSWNGAVAGDYDNDGRPDVFVLRDEGHSLVRQKNDGAFEDVTRAALPPATASYTTAAFADVDHDGDLDIYAAGDGRSQADTEPRGSVLLRNNGNGTFTDVTSAAGLVARLEGAVAVAAADFDNRRDIDLLVAARGRAPVLFRNMRDGSFRDFAADTALPASGRYSALATADINKDGYTDVFLAKEDEAGVFAVSDGNGRFRSRQAPDESRGASQAQFVDYDNDGLLDLLTVAGGRVRMFRNTGAERLTDTTGAARLAALTPDEASAVQSVALGDLDGDGDTDMAVRTTTGGLRVWRNDGGNQNVSLRVRLAARVSNRSGVGAKLELRAGSLRQTLDTSASFPAGAPADVVFGLGSRQTADVVRVLWPSGILQAEMSGAITVAARAQQMTVAELDRKPSSCPYLFTWNGRRFDFLTDFMGGGEMGGWAGPAAWNQPDPDEYVRIPGDALQPRDGHYELRITNELEEALFVDRLQLVAVDHPQSVLVFPNEGLKQPPRAPFKLTGVRDTRLPVRASDEHGHDVLPQIAARDRQYPDDFELLPIRGYAARHELTLDLGPGSDRALLLMTGWTDYAFSSDNVAASQSGTALIPPSLQVKDASGAWRTVIDEIGLPVGRPQTIVVDLNGKFLSASRQVRIVTNMRIFWDEILVASAVDDRRFAMTRLDAVGADLRWRGLSTEVTPDGREPFGYDYHRVSAAVPWKVMTGRYTREGDVRPLLRATDDMFVISRPGDEIAVSFDARSLKPAAPGWTRTFLLYVYGYSKEMNPRSASPDTVAPLPFRAMRTYPYAADEHYPRTKAHRDYLTRYNTRVVSKSLPPLVAPVVGRTARVASGFSRTERAVSAPVASGFSRTAPVPGTATSQRDPR